MHVVRINNSIFAVGVAAMVLLLQSGYGVADGRQTRPTHRVTCQREHAVKRASSVIIYVTRTSATDDLGNPLVRYSACRRPNGASVTVGHNAPASDDGGGVSDDELQQLVIGGDYAGSLELFGSGSDTACEFSPADCASLESYEITLADVDPVAVGHLYYSGTTRDLMISAAGAAAWITSVPSSPPPASETGTTTTRATTTPPTVTDTEKPVVAAPVRHGRTLKIAVQTAATGTVSNVHLSGLTLTWSQAGQSRTLTVQH